MNYHTRRPPATQYEGLISTLAIFGDSRISNKGPRFLPEAFRWCNNYASGGACLANVWTHATALNVNGGRSAGGLVRHIGCLELA